MDDTTKSLMSQIQSRLEQLEREGKIVTRKSSARSPAFVAIENELKNMDRKIRNLSRL